jgi:hypothetical protein
MCHRMFVYSLTINENALPRGIHGRNAILIDTKAKESERLPCAFSSKFHPRGDHSGRSYAKECDILKSTKPRPS